MAAIIDKHNRLEEVISNRLIFVSGSSMAFGVDSEPIQQQFSINVVNLALQAGLGCEFIINEAMHSVKKGDIIILCLEYELYDLDHKPNIELISYTQQLYPPSRAFYHLSFKDSMYVIFQNFRKFFQKKDHGINAVYNRNAFNKFGDVIGHLNKPCKYDAGHIKLRKADLSQSVEFIKKLHRKCDEVDAGLYLMFPCFPTTDYKNNQETINALDKKIRDELDNIRIINTCQTFVFDEKYFFDTEYHLNSEGRQLMTDKLIDVLKVQVFPRYKIQLGSDDGENL